MSSVIQSLRLIETSKFIILVILLFLNFAPYLCQNQKDPVTQSETNGLFQEEQESRSHPKQIPWAFSSTDLMYLVKQESKLYILMKNYQLLTKSDEQLELVKRYKL